MINYKSYLNAMRFLILFLLQLVVIIPIASAERPNIFSF